VIELTGGEPKQGHEEIARYGWEVHRYRHVDDPALAETLIWQLLGRPMSDGREPVALDLHREEQAFRELVPRMQQELASAERAKTALRPPD